jgi:hypothetical protein
VLSGIERRVQIVGPLRPFAPLAGRGSPDPPHFLLIEGGDCSSSRGVKFYVDCQDCPELAIYVRRSGPAHSDRKSCGDPPDPTDFFPNIDIPIIAVSWDYAGLNPQEMEGRITSVYERVLTTTVDNIEHIESTTINGTAVVRVYL